MKRKSRAGVPRSRDPNGAHGDDPPRSICDRTDLALVKQPHGLPFFLSPQQLLGLRVQDLDHRFVLFFARSTRLLQLLALCTENEQTSTREDAECQRLEAAHHQTKTKKKKDESNNNNNNEWRASDWPRGTGIGDWGTEISSRKGVQLSSKLSVE